MTNRKVRSLLSQYEAGIRTPELAKRLIAAQTNFSPRGALESESEDLQSAPADEAAWQALTEWLKRHGKNE